MASSPPSFSVRTGILWMLATTVFFTGANVGAKYLAADLHQVEVTG